jgi:hypothetical protein
MPSIATEYTSGGFQLGKSIEKGSVNLIQIITFPIYKGEMPYSGEMIQKGIRDTKRPSIIEVLQRP